MYHRAYGPSPSSLAPVVVVHGGPGAPGSVGALAQLIADPLFVLEPWQRASGDTRLTVARHIADLADFVGQRCARPPLLVGHSWGAMLVLAFAAAHPRLAAAIALVACGTFDLEARAVFQRAVRDRVPRGVDLDALPEQEWRAIIDDIYALDPLPADPLDRSEIDRRASEESWSDMTRLQAEGIYPAAFAAITCPVLMLHGTDDPHPGPLIRASLAAFVPQLDYRELRSCGHDPWRERSARTEFAALLRAWLLDRAT